VKVRINRSRFGETIISGRVLMSYGDEFDWMLHDDNGTPFPFNEREIVSVNNQVCHAR
jgi:hypothetical protein